MEEKVNSVNQMVLELPLSPSDIDMHISSDRKL